MPPNDFSDHCNGDDPEGFQGLVDDIFIPFCAISVSTFAALFTDKTYLLLAKRRALIE